MQNAQRIILIIEQHANNEAGSRWPLKSNLWNYIKCKIL